MIINGKEVNIDPRRSAQIQDKVNKTEFLPDSAKTELSKKDIKDLNTFITDSYNSFDGYGVSNTTLLTGKNSKENRKEYYLTYQEMDETNFIHRGLQIIADDCSQKNQYGNRIKIYSDDDEIKEVLEEMFITRLNIDKEIWSIIYETCKLGDNFYEIIPDSYQNPTMVSRIRYLEPERVNRIEKNGKLAFYTYTADLSSKEEMEFNFNVTGEKQETEKMMYKLEPWQIIHFRIPDKDFYPYGGSLLKAGVKCYRRLQLLEDGMVIYRLARVPERRVFKIDVGNLPTNEANRYVNKIKDNYRTTQIMDDRGNINRNAAALALTSDIFVPMREGSSGTDITTLQAGTALNNIDDIRYFRDQILWTMNIPPEYLGFTSDQSGGSAGRGSLAMQDVKFSRFAERIQYYIEEGLTKIASIELFFKHKKKTDLQNFKIELTPPSNIKELMNIEYLLQKMNLIQAMNGTGLFSKKFILEYVMQMSKKEVDDLLFFKDLESQQTANMQAMDGAMMGGGMDIMGGAANAAPAETLAPEAAPQPQSSINTEEGLEKKLVNIFGKDVLIENKEDFAKLIKAADEFNKKQKEVKEEDKEIDEIASSYIITEMQKAFGIENKEKTNTSAMSLIYENEFGGLNFDEKKLSTFKTNNKGKKILTEEKYIEETITLK